MPANRSRTENWMSSLEQIVARGGAVELAVAPPASDAESDARPCDLVWRVKLVSIEPTHLVVGVPSVAGQLSPIGPGAGLNVSYTIGQNRWVFASQTLGLQQPSARAPGEGPKMLIALPTTVERRPRRQYERVSLRHFLLPEVRCWPLLDPTSAAPAESANRALLEARLSGASTDVSSTDGVELPDEVVLPNVGPGFTARLANVSGGGLGLTTSSDCGPALDRHAFYWLQVPMRPLVDAHLGVTVRRLHTHLDASGEVYAGFCFDFSLNPGHQTFVASMLTKYMGAVQERSRSAA